MKNPYIRRSRITEEVTIKMLSCFAYDLTAAETARKITFNPRTIKFHFSNIRRRIQSFYKEEINEVFTELGVNTGMLMNNNTEVTYSKKQLQNFPILALTFIHEDGVYLQTEMICSESKAFYETLEQRLLSLIPERITGFGFADLKFQKLPEPIYISKGSQSTGKEITVGNFWDYAGSRRKQFRSIDIRTAYYHLKEAQWRFNFDEARLRNNALAHFNITNHTFQRADPKKLFSELIYIISNDPL